ALAIAIAITTITLLYVINLFLGSSLILRGLITLTILCPIAILMGMPFPIGMRMLGEKEKEIIPWAWCINGVASVISSILAIIVAMSFGFNSVLLLAALTYFIAGVVMKK
ncbi:hypothetical protein, partial [Methanobacterium sp.]|uniref:hypothetical protein n=1 Tax=Methanobacterium sp. TaxID=2164 RepID=UPI00345B5C5F|nr:hypothetical protein [Methanobacterium sp.]